MTTLNLLKLIPRKQRKLRTRQAARIYHLALVRENSKKLFLRLFRVTGNFKQCADHIGVYGATVQQWMRDDPNFKDQYQEHKDSWAALLGTRFETLSEQALEGVEDMLKDPMLDDALKLKLYGWILTSKGVGQPSSVSKVEVSGPGGGPIPVRAINVHLKGPDIGQPALEESIVDVGEYSLVNEEEDER